MENLFIKPTVNTPKVSLDKDKGLIQLAGKSIPDSTSRRYRPVMDWIYEYVKNPQPKTQVKFNIEYLNSTTLKFYYIIMKKMEELHKSGFDVNIEWKYEEDDEDILETGEYLISVVDVPINLVEIEEGAEEED
ncbi:MAG: DUF1987 domain-containing protein [Bacteroidia bacterium]|nr:DUF1987 domain-containing protein [Bacteroidia bacterium]